MVLMDMWGPYRGVVKTKLPWAEIVADRFHGMKQLNDAIAEIRRRLQTKADPASYELLKGIRWILVRNRADLKPEEEAKLQAALDAFPELRTAYLLKERFALIANKIQDRTRAERFLRAWLYEAQASGIAPLVISLLSPSCTRGKSSSTTSTKASPVRWLKVSTTPSVARSAGLTATMCSSTSACMSWSSMPTCPSLSH